MSELDPSVESTSADKAETAPLASPGALLREARLAAGLHIAALAVSLKVPVRRLEAMEADRFDILPGAVFVRALACSICRALKVDATPVLALLPASTPPRLGMVNDGAREPYESADTLRRRPAWRSIPKPVLASAAALVVLTLLLLSFPFLRSSWDSAWASSGGQASPELLNSAVKAPGAEDGVAAASTLPALPVIEIVNAGPPVPVQPPAVTLPAAALAAVPVAAAPTVPVANSNGILVFRPSAQSWVEVTDAAGTVVLRRMLTAGEVVGVSGSLPLSAVVGRADAIKVQVRGQAFDLSAIARDNVARFEVK